jgi:hypothetical protein
MQFLPLKQVAAAARVSRTWRAASLSPLVWLDRRCFAHVDIGDGKPPIDSSGEERVTIRLSQLARVAASSPLFRMHTLSIGIHKTAGVTDVTAALNQIHAALPHLMALRVPTVSRLDQIPPLVSHPLAAHSSDSDQPAITTMTIRTW